MEIIHTEEEKAEIERSRRINGIVNPFSKNIAREWYGHVGTEPQCTQLANFIERHLWNLFRENRIALPPNVSND